MKIQVVEFLDYNHHFKVILSFKKYKDSLINYHIFKTDLHHYLLPLLIIYNFLESEFFRFIFSFRTINSIFAI